MQNPVARCAFFRTSNLHVLGTAILFGCAAFGLAPSAFADTLIWSGGGATAKWSDSGNWSGVVPADGDILVFQAGQPKPVNTNDLSNLTLSRIRFIGASGGYNIFGNSFTLSNNVNTIQATNAVGVNTISNNITVPSSNLAVNVASGAKLILYGSLSGAGGVVKNGSGTNTLAGRFSNTYGGVTTVNAGLMELAKDGITFTATAIPHDLIIGDEADSDIDTVRLLAVNQIPSGASVTIKSNGVLDLNASYEGLGAIFGTGNLQLGTQYLDLYNTNGCTFDGIISGPGFLRQAAGAPGTLTLNGNNTYTGPTLINGGTVLVNGQQPQSHVTVTPNTSLGGSGTVGNILCQGHLKPGNSPGILTCSNLTFTAGSTYDMEISGRIAGLQYDQMNVRGTNNLANAGLAISTPLSNAVSVGDQIVIINNDGVDAITGNFAGYTPGAAYAANGFTFVISYTNGTGNDVVFTVTSVSGNVVTSSVTAGNGDHVIAPNECNNLTIVITNGTGTPMTGVSAVLSTTTSGVEITQPYSSYPNLPANGNATNNAPFQISVLPSFTCGNDINLQLTVHPLSHGAFTVPMVVHSGATALVPLRFDISTTVNVPDVGTIESTNVVTGVSRTIAKVAVSLWMSAPFDSDLNISLIAPDGTLVDLSSANGSGSNFGSSCSPDSSRTTFDDSAAASITAGSSPFVGTFRPEGLLSSVLASPMNGNWRLRVNDTLFAGNPDTLGCWSLLLYPLECAPGSGPCGLCLPPIFGSINNSDPVEVVRLFRNGVLSSCNTLKNYPGPSSANLHYDAYTVTNSTGAEACVTVEIAASCNVQGVAYLNRFDPNDVAKNYLGDAGFSTAGGGTVAFSCNVPSGATFVIVVNEVNPGEGCNSYSLTLSGLPCPSPTLQVERAPAATARLFWPSSAGGYLLESSPAVAPANWSAVTNEPVVAGGNYNVTNATAAPQQFYRLHKP